MNLILLRPGELQPGGKAVLRDRRHRHVRQVLGALPGERLRVGLLDGPLGEDEVVRSDDGATELSCTFDGEAPPRGQDTLLLAIPRPKVLGRCLEHATALGFGRILLARTWRVDKSWLDSRELGEAAVREHLVLGLEQSRRTRLPEVVVARLWRPFVEDHLATLLPAPGARFVAHPAAALPIARCEVGSGPFTVAIGPEGGFVPFEIETLERQGFVAVSCGPHPLRVETAVAVVHAQIGLLRDIATGGAQVNVGRDRTRSA